MSRCAQAGLSLIELMIALALGSLLMLGLLKVFEATRASYKLSEGLARVQENGRFAVDYLQRDLRMVGHMGCVNDQARFLGAPVRFSSALVVQDRPSEAQFDAASAPLRFHTMLQGFEASGTAPGGSVSVPATGAWSGSPALPTYISTLAPAPMAGSDVVAVRYFSPESAPVKAFDGARITVDTARWNTLLPSASDAQASTGMPGMLAIADCLNAVTFQATAINRGATDTTLQVNVSGLNRSSLVGRTFTAGQSTLYRAESLVYYVGINPSGGEPTLFRARFGAAPGASSPSLVGGAPEPIAEGVENLQLIYGQDSQTDGARAPTGYIATQNAANSVQTGSDTSPWRRVGLIQVALLTRSTERAGVPATEVAEPPRLLGVQVAVPADGRYRNVYESTIALRNRLYGN